jgi:hypothetical protein
MQFLLDHIRSFIVFSAIILIVVLLQLRGIQSSAETVTNYMVRSGTLDISEMLERDLTNMRTQTQTDWAISQSNFKPAAIAAYECKFTMSSDTTMSFSFPTLEDPQTDYADPTTAPVVQVVYQLTRLSGAVAREIGGATISHPLYRLDRIAGDDPNGWSDDSVTYFRIEFAERANPAFQVPAGVDCPTALSKIRFQIQMAKEGFEEPTDQKSKSQLNFSRYGATVELSNWD